MTKQSDPDFVGERTHTPASEEHVRAAEPASTGEPSPLYVGSRLTEMRAARNLSLDELAAAAGMSRSTLAAIESGKTTPSLGVVWRIAVGLGVPFAELLRGNGHGASVLRAGEAQVLHSADDALHSRPLTPAGFSSSVEIYELTLRARGTHAAEPHPTGTREVVILLSGALRVRVEPGSYDLTAGDSVTFRADVPHAYENPGDVDAIFHNLIVYTP